MCLFYSPTLCPPVFSERQKTAVDTTTPQAWVKIASAWICGLLYIWTLIAPVLFPNRDFRKGKFAESAQGDDSMHAI